MLKKDKLRYNEYYDMQHIYDELYAQSKNGNNFYKLLEIIGSEQNICLAYRNLKTNSGSKTAGTDGLTIDDIKHLCDEDIIMKVRSSLDNYQPKSVRRVFIPKSGSDKRRPLGIPCIWDRLVQQCILQVLEPICEPKFHNHSYGFRANRSAHHALGRVTSLINISKYHYCVDVDIKGFFDNVNHGKLLKQIWTLGIRDKRLICIISKMLKAEIDGEGVPEKGTPQGGPLSPLLANIMLDELDKELEKRGHKFCRYADDNNVYVKSKRAGIRVMESMIKLIENKLKLKVNKDKSAVDFVSKRKFLGFSFYFAKGGAEIRIHEKSIKRFKDKIKFYTNRNIGISMESRLKKLNQIMRGWINYYGIANAVAKLKELDKWIRRRLRACIWKQWKKISTRHRNLVKLGINKYKAWEYANTRKGYWRISKSPILSKSLNNKYLESLGFVSLTQTYQMMH